MSSAAMNAKSIRSKLEKKGRVRASDTSMARNILYGHPDGKGGLKEWSAADLDRSYNLPYRWSRAILKYRDDARALDVHGGLGTTGMDAVRWYARKIATIRDSSLR